MNALLPLLALLTLGPVTSLAQSALRHLQSAIGNPYLFQGARYDSETGFYYFRNRHYDPRAGRFLQRDPVWDEQNVGGWHTFVGSGPASRRDPLGLNEDAELKEAVQSYNLALVKFIALQERGNVPPDELQKARREMMLARARVERERAWLKLKESEENQRRIAQSQPVAPPQQAVVCPAGTQTIEEMEQELAVRTRQLAELEERKKAWSTIETGEWAGTRTYWGVAVDAQGKPLPLPNPEEEAQVKSRIQSLVEELRKWQKRLAEEQAAASSPGKQNESCPPQRR